MPITWRNVESRGVGDAARLLEGSRQSLNAGVNQIGGVFDDRQALSEKRYDVGVENNTDAFHNELNKYKTPEELQAAQQSGAIDALRSQFGQQIDEDAVRNAFVDRLNTLRGDEQASAKYRKFQIDEQADPIRSRLDSLLAGGDIVGFDAELTPENRELFSRQGTLDDLIGARTSTIRETKNYNDAQLQQKMAEDGAALSQEIISTATSGAAARAEFELRAIQQNIVGDAYNNELEKIEGRWTELNSLDTDQERLLTQFTADQQSAAQGLVDQENLVLQETIRRNPVDERFSFLNEARVTMGDVIATAEEAGWDKDYLLGGSLPDDLNKIHTDFVSKMDADVKKTGLVDADGNPRAMTENEKSVLPAILKLAVQEQGSEDHIFEKDNIDKESVRDSMDRLYNAYVNSLNNEAVIAEARKSATGNINTYLSNARTAADTKKNEFIRANKGLRDLREQ